MIPSAIFAFPISGKPVSCEPFGGGHINRTYKVQTDTNHSYILQSINRYVFTDPVALMENIDAVTKHLRRKSDKPYATLHFLECGNGSLCYKDSEGEYWRCYDFIPGFSLDAPECDADLFQCALAFGRFQSLLSDFPAHTLHETIPEFHNTIDRYRKLKAAISADICGRAASVCREIGWSMDLEEAGSRLETMRRQGLLPLRVTHNDTKMNNTLLSAEDRTSLCVIDLDTVMPGLSAYDFGDSIRSGASTGAEDEGNAGLDLHLFEVYTRGYLQAVENLTEAECKALSLGAFTMTLEVGIRFLTDYLEGDVYFKTHYPEQNRIRATAQLTLARDMYTKLPEMDAIVAKILAEKE